MTQDEIRAACEADLRSQRGEGRSPKKASGIPNPIEGLFKNLNQDARNALAVAAIGGAAAGFALSYATDIKHFNGFDSWLSYHWDEALFSAASGALIASAVVYVLMIALRRT